MKQFYRNKKSVVPGLFLMLFSLSVMSQIPVPDAFYKFDEASGNQITDASGNGAHGYWYNYFGEAPGAKGRSGWKPEQGYRGGAAYLAGDHSFGPENCPEEGKDCKCSSGTDLLIFAPDTKLDSAGNPASCYQGILAKSAVYHKEYDALTIAFWFKNEWNYFCGSNEPLHYSYLDDSDCASERQVLYTQGDGTTGITIEVVPSATYNAVLKATINGGTEGQQVSLLAVNDSILFRTWTHIAVSFEGDSEAGTGIFSLFMDGKLEKSIETVFSVVPEEKSSAVFGAENGASVTNFNVSTCWNSEGDKSLMCGITPEYYGTLRYGWPARGYLDELAVWSYAALTENEISEFAISGLTTGASEVTLGKNYNVYPTIVKDYFSIVNLSANQENNITVFNITGAKVIEVKNISANQRINLPSNLNDGIYLVYIKEKGEQSGMKKIILNRN